MRWISRTTKLGKAASLAIYEINMILYRSIYVLFMLSQTNFCRQTELRQALEEQCGLFEVCRIAGGKVLPEELRIRAWQVCMVNIDSAASV